MAGLIDPSVLLGARGIQLPDPMALAQQSMTLAELADRRRMREYQMAQAARQDEAARALEAAMPGAIRAGFSDESIAGADPRAQAALLAAAEKYRKNRADVGKTEAETDEKRVKALRERFATIGGNAFELSQKPDLTPDDVGAFVSHARGLGLSAESLGGMPAGDQASMRAYLRGIADKSVGALDKLKLAGDAAARSETNRHNTTTEGLTAARDAATAAHYAATEKNAAARLNVDKATADALMRGEPKEITVDGKPVLAIYDKKSGTFFDANTRQPIRAGMSPKEGDMPASLREKMAQNEVTIAKIDRALKLVGKYPDAFGAKNYAPDAAIQRIDPEGVEARALVSDVAGQKIHDRSGAAVTIGEMARLRPYIPNVTDSPETIKTKLAMFRREYAAVQAEIAKGRSLADMISQRGGGATAEWGGAPGGEQAAPQRVSSLPDPAKHRGYTATADDGTRYRSDGSRWVRY